METKIEVTEWHSGDTAPVRQGWYERQFTHGIYMQWWDCGRWFPQVYSMRPSKHPDWCQVGSYVKWRGMRRWVLTTNPSHDEPQYLHRVDLGAAELWGVALLPAIGFDSEAEALDFAAKLPMTRDAVAVLP